MTLLAEGIFSKYNEQFSKSIIWNSGNLSVEFWIYEFYGQRGLLRKEALDRRIKKEIN